MEGCCGLKEKNVQVEAAKIAVISTERAKYFKNRLNEHLNKIPFGKTTLVHMLCKYEMCDIYIDNDGKMDVLYEKSVNNRDEWIKKSCWSWNFIYCGTIKDVENLIYLENGEVIIISDLKE